MQTKKILLTGGPGTGKTSVLNALKKCGYCCFEEVSRKITLEAQKEGISQLFLKNPHLFSRKLLEGRVAQFKKANLSSEKICFMDRGIPEIGAYMSYKNEEIPKSFIEANQTHLYDVIFFFPIWEEIYKSDNERYESLEEAKEIQRFIKESHENMGYQLIEMPKTNVLERINFMMKKITDEHSK